MDADVSGRDSKRAYLALTSEAIWRFSTSTPVPVALAPEEQAALMLRNGVLTECNDAFAHRHDAGATEIIGRRVTDFIADDDQYRDTLLAFVRGGYRLEGFETIETTPSGERRHYLIGMVGVVRAGHVVEAWGSQVDVTERNRRERQVRQVQAMDAVSRLAGSVAHDFNNLLTTILTSAETLGDTLDGEHAGQHDLEEIRQSARQGAELTRQLLAMSRQQVLAPRPVDVNGVVRRVEGRLRDVFTPATTVSLTTAAAASVAHVDVEELEQTLIHLATHAAGSMGTSGSFAVVVERERLAEGRRGVPDEVPAGEYVALRVSHSRVSRAAEPALVQPFTGAESASLGTGLALATVHGFMLQSAGALLFESREGGVDYTLYFPAAALPAPRDPVTKAALSAGDRRTILLAEDEPTVRLLMKRVLERAGYAVLVASDGEEALAISRAYGSTIDALVTDVIMPGMGGGELSRTIGAERPGIRVLHVSGYTAGALLNHDALEHGAAFLQKPFTATTLRAKLRDVFTQ